MNTLDFNKKQANAMAQTLFGKSIQRIVRRNVDADYNEKKRKGEDNLLLIKPLRLYAIETIVVSSLAVVATPNDDCMIQINNDDSLMFPITDAAIAEPTNDQMIDALENFEDGKNPKYFADYAGVCSKVLAWNEAETARGEAAMNDLVKQIAAIRKANEAENSAFKAYEKQYRG